MTSYKLATKPYDYKKAYDFCKRMDSEPEHKVTHPTILVERDDKIIGLLGTLKVEGHNVHAGPLVIDLPKGRNFGVIVIRLVEVYEAFLKAAGVSYYLFTIDRDKTDWISIVMKVFQIEPYALDEGRLCFIRRI